MTSTGRTGGLARHLAVSLVAAATTWAATWSWGGFTADDSPWLAPLLVLAVIVAVTGAVGRWARVPGPLLALGQVLLTALAAVVLLTGSLVPGPGTAARLGRLVGGALDSAQQYAAPVPVGVPSIAPLLVLGGLACVLAVDLLAGTLRRAALAGLPLLTAYALPVSMLGSGAPWPVFAVVAAGFLVLLALQEDDRVERWGRGLVGGGGGVLGRPAAARAGAGAVGGAATVLALAVPVAVPTAGLTFFEGGLRSSGDGEIELEDPMVDLRRDLKRDGDVPLVSVRTDDPDPDYLRITVLERFSENAWTSGGRDLPDEQRTDGNQLATTGVDATVAAASPRHDYTLSATDDFASAWLPHPFPIASVEAPGNWKYDLSTLDFLATDQDGDLDTSGMSWTAVGLVPAFDEATLDAAPAADGYVDAVYNELPSDLPPIVSDLARSVTAGARTDLERAKALQYFFRVGGDFQYSLEADDGNGGDALAEFLSESPEGRIGYCEQFASAMAVMAREVGIPSRVAMGFLEPEQVAPREFVYSSDDLHAWPELYFAGQGWVRFEPTPGGAGGPAQSPPPWSLGEAPAPAPEPSQGSLGEDPLDPDRNGAAAPAPTPAPEPEDAAAADDEAGAPWRTTGAGLGVLLLLAALVALPRTVRRARSTRRWEAASDGTAPVGLVAWRELQEGCADLGVPWPTGRSPEATRLALRPVMTAGPLAADEALARVARLVEQEWYAPPGATPADPAARAAGVRADVDLVLEAVADGASAPARFTAQWLPVSVLRRSGSRRLPGPRPVGADQVG